MSVRALGVQEHNTAAPLRSRCSGFWQECAMRIGYFISKYFLRFIEGLHPKIFWESIKSIGKEIYWRYDARFRFSPWFKRDIQHSTVHFKHHKLYGGGFNKKEFLASQNYQTLKEAIPFVKNIERQGTNWIDISAGTCCGQSIMALKHEQAFDVDQGFTGLDTSLWKDKVEYVQIVDNVQSILEAGLKFQKKLDNAQIHPYEFLSTTQKVDKVYLFHSLRKVGVSRLEAHALCDEYPDLFAYSIDELKEQIKSCARLKDDFFTDKNIIQLFSNHKKYKKKEQTDLDGEVLQFLSEQTGKFLFLCRGERQGHYMFIKIEHENCVVYDPGIKVSFVTPRTRDGVFKIVELMKKVMIITNRGGNVFYNVSGLIDSKAL